MTDARPLKSVTTMACIVLLCLVSPLQGALAATSSVCGLQSRYIANCPRPPAPPRPQPPGDDGGDIFKFIIGLAIVIGFIAIIDSTTGSAESVDHLDQQGPKPPHKEYLGRYQVQGLVYPGWPVVVELAAQPGTTTYIQVVPQGGDAGTIPPLVISEDGRAPWGNKPVIRPVEQYAT